MQMRDRYAHMTDTSPQQASGAMAGEPAGAQPGGATAEGAAA